MSEKTTETENTENTESVDEVLLEPAVQAYQHLFDLPVAVQLRMPVVAMDARMGEETREDGRYLAWWRAARPDGGAPSGFPEEALSRDEKGDVRLGSNGAPMPALLQVLMGKLGPSPDGSQLVLQYRTDRGAHAAVMMRPDAIDCVSWIPTVPADMRLGDAPEPAPGNGRIIHPA